MSRGLAFWSDDLIRRVRERFVAAAVPTWVARSETPEGEFLRSAGVDKQWVTSSGYMTCLSAGGTLLGREPKAEILEKFAALPEEDRRPGAIRDLAAAERAVPAPPEGGLVLRVHARFLARGADGELRAAATSDFPLMEGKKGWELFLQPNTEYLWLKADEWRALVPAEPVVGREAAVDPSIAERLARFHLTPQRATTSEGGVVSRRAVKSARLSLLVRAVTAEWIDLALSGHVHWGSDYDEAKATTPDGPLAQGFETRLHGRLTIDRARGAFTRFDVVAPGEIWGRWGDANGKSLPVERPGRAPFGFALELAGASATDRLPPGGNGRTVSDQGGYFGPSGSR